MIKCDLNGSPFEFEPLNIDKKEYSKIIHEINNIYHSKYFNEQFGMHRSIDLNGNYCIYLFEIHGFGDYNVYGKFYD